MQAEVNGKVIELSEAGWLVNLDEWSEELAAEVAKNEKIGELTQEHWDIINTGTRVFPRQWYGLRTTRVFQDHEEEVRQRSQRPEVHLLTVSYRSDQMRQQGRRSAAPQRLQLNPVRKSRN